MTHDAIVDVFRKHLKAIKRKPGQTIVAIFDAIISMPGVVMPWERMVAVCKEEGVISLVDGAHAIGQVPLQLNQVDPDYFVSNCHKWLYAKRGTALFYVPKRNQHLIKTTLPTSWSYVGPNDPPSAGTPPNFVAQFEVCGTIDLVPHLTIAKALEFRKTIGGEKKINDYCHFLAIHGGRLAAETLGTRVMDEDGSLTANMVNVLLPLTLPSNTAMIQKLADLKIVMLTRFNTAVNAYVHDGKWWARLSAQVFNEMSDFGLAAKQLKTLCEEWEAAVRSAEQ